MNDLLIKGGLIVSAADTYQADLYIHNGRIATIGRIKNITEHHGIRIIDARGCYVIPGGIDVHVHFSFPVKGFNTTDDFYTGTVAAAAGGTTTVIDMLPPPGINSLQTNVEIWRKTAEKQAVVDYCFQQIINRVEKCLAGGKSFNTRRPHKF